MVGIEYKNCRLGHICSDICLGRISLIPCQTNQYENGVVSEQLFLHSDFFISTTFLNGKIPLALDLINMAYVKSD